MLLAFGAFVFAHDAMYRLHRRWFDLSVTRFDELTFGLFALYKLAIWFFLLIPGLVLMALGERRRGAAAAVLYRSR